MIVKIGNSYYDPNDMPIMIILTEKDKENIKNMHPDATKYCAFPSGTKIEEIEEFMRTPEKFRIISIEETGKGQLELNFELEVSNN